VPAKSIVLFVLDPSGQRTRVQADKFPFHIGRQPDNQLVLRDNRTSRTHARIVQNGEDEYALEDMASRHGTWVNGKKIDRHILRDSDRIEFGVTESYQITFTLDNSTGALNTQAAAGVRPRAGLNALEKLRSVVEVARAVHNSLSAQEVLTAVVDAALNVTSCERGFLLLKREATLDISVARDREGRQLEATDLRVPRSVIHKALESRRELLSMMFDPLAMQAIHPDMSIAALEIRSVVCLPLVQVRSGNHSETRMTSAADSTVGLLYLDSRLGVADLSAGNREMLETLAMEASTILENARLLEEERSKVKMENELRIAREIQQGLLPRVMPSEGWFRSSGSSTPARQVGGDYYDVRRVSDDVWAAMVADVCGKGVSSALLAGFLQGAFQMTPGNPEALEPTVSHLNSFLLERTGGEKYATLFYLTIHSSGLMSYINAGHCEPFIVGVDGKLRRLATTGMPVGMLEATPFETAQETLQPGEKLVIFSDGLTEAANAQGQFYDTDRLRLCLLENASKDARGLHDVLVKSVEKFTGGTPSRDDITTLVIEYAPLQ
jgi:serine phosphatase RsbU (regulator of sigma subunit)